MSRKARKKFVAVWLILSLSGAWLVGAREESFRVVAVTGNRVHLRWHRPLTLDHRGVRRHLSAGELFYVERIGYGVSRTGQGLDDVWFFVRSLRDLDDEGWVHSRFLQDLPGTYTPVPQPAPTQPVAPAEPIAPAAHTPGAAPLVPSAGMPSIPQVTLFQVPPPPESSAVDLLSIMASIFTMLSLLATWFLAFGLPGGHSPPSYIPSRAGSNTRKPNYYYGKHWRISAK